MRPSCRSALLSRKEEVSDHTERHQNGEESAYLISSHLITSHTPPLLSFSILLARHVDDWARLWVCPQILLTVWMWNPTGGVNSLTLLIPQIIRIGRKRRLCPSALILTGLVQSGGNETRRLYFYHLIFFFSLSFSKSLSYYGLTT